MSLGVWIFHSRKTLRRKDAGKSRRTEEKCRGTEMQRKNAS
jgi:hypothetical protein